MSNSLQNIYSNSSEVVRAKGLDLESATSCYEKYLNFIRQSSPADGKLLDVGCGSGWSSYLLNQLGYQVTGIDLNGSAFECPKSEKLTLVEGSSLALPFDNETFDVVASHQAIEHMPDPQKALTEMIRVLKPGGTLCIVGPNLLSIGGFVMAITKYVWQKENLKSVFFRSPDMPKHPWGNTLPEVLVSFPLKIWLIISKSVSTGFSFSMREPDTVPPFIADNDACYLSNPIDFIKFLPTQKMKIIQNGYYGRPKWTNLIVSGMFIAAKKT